MKSNFLDNDLVTAVKRFSQRSCITKERPSAMLLYGSTRSIFETRRTGIHCRKENCND